MRRRRAARQSESPEPNWDSKKRRWTAEEEQILRNEYPVSSTTEVAEKLRRSEKAVRFRAHNLGIQKIRPGTTRPDVWRAAEEIAQAYRFGKSQAALAREYEVNTSTIRQLLVSEGCTIRDQGYYARRRRIRIGNELYMQCTKCKQWKPRTEQFFRPYPGLSDRFRARCAECDREAERQYLAEHPEKREEMRKYSRRYHRRMSRGLWAARWRLVAEQLLQQEEKEDG